MKSLVQEAASIQKAIEQAWQKAGNPKEFQVKVLEEPERNFLGIVTRSAKVAIVFDIAQVQMPSEKQKSHEKREVKGKQQRDTKREQRPSQETEKKNVQERKHKQQEPTQKQQDKRTQQEEAPADKQKHTKQTSAKQREQREQTEKRTAAAKQKTETQQSSKSREKTAQDKQSEKQQSSAEAQQKGTQKAADASGREQKKPKSLWTEERVQHASQWLRDVLDKMGYTDISFTTEPQNLYLRIELSDKLLTRKDREKQLLASLASLMMATMQRTYNKAFRGHKVVLTHP